MKSTNFWDTHTPVRDEPYRFPFARLWVLHSIWQLWMSVAPPLLQAVTWSASMSLNFQIFARLAACPMAHTTTSLVLIIARLPEKSKTSIEEIGRLSLPWMTESFRPAAFTFLPTHLLEQRADQVNLVLSNVLVMDQESVIADIRGDMENNPIIVRHPHLARPRFITNRHRHLYRVQLVGLKKFPHREKNPNHLNSFLRQDFHLWTLAKLVRTRCHITPPQ